MMKWIVFSAIFMLAACSQEVPNVSKPVTSPAPPAAATPGGERVERGLYRVEIQSVSCSDAPVAIAKVEWDASAAAASSVAVYVESPNNPRKLWLEGGAKGSEVTGNWVFAGSRFTFVDKSAGTELASRDVPEVSCGVE